MEGTSVWAALVALSTVCFASPVFQPLKNLGSCGYQSCNPVKDGMINVHLVPHTHDDVGWLKTVDQYYYGGKMEINRAEVEHVLDTVIQELLKDPNRRFIYVEIAFFYRWWRQQSESMQQQVRQLVEEGRLEFILGGWCMNDEASTHYNAIIDQHTIGFQFLRENFGECGRPRVAWQIDPFGHSREQASLFAQMGFDGLFFGRLDYQDKNTRLQSKTMETIWKGSPKNLGDKANLFTGALYNGYGPPGGFCWDIGCTDEQIQDDPRLHDFNVQARVNDFMKAVQDQAKHYATDHLIMTMGSDFQYSDAITWYTNLDKIIKYVNAEQSKGSKVNLLYSTPSCYLYQVNRANKTWTTKEDDYFPYAHRAHSFWTGYFTSRATLKDYVRRTNNFLQVVKRMDVLAQPDSETGNNDIDILKKAMGVVQHHDAVSGTEKQAVAYDYAMRLAEGVTASQNVINKAYKKLLPLGSEQPPDMAFCPLVNISVCSVIEDKIQFQVHVFNPLSHDITWYVRIPVPSLSYVVSGPKNQSLVSQVIPLPPDTYRIPERKDAKAKYELVFPADIPSLGFNTYYVQATHGTRNRDKKSAKRSFLRRVQDESDIVLKNDLVSLTLDGQTKKIKGMTNLKKNIAINLNQDFLFYTSFAGNNSKDVFQASGAYVFRPNPGPPQPVGTGAPTVMTSLKQNQLVQEVSQQFNPWVTQNIRLYENKPYVELEWTVGPIDISDKVGKEIISKFSTGLNTEATFYTDANGREILKRVRDHRDTWKLNQTEPVAGNYYPINSRIFLQDTSKNVQFTVLTDRSEGGGSIQDGNLEIMVHRRILNDDSLGVGEALNETGADGKGLIVRGRHYLFLDTIADSAALHREMALRLYMSPQLSFTTDSSSYEDWSRKFRTTWSGLNVDLPANVHLLTLEPHYSIGPVAAHLYLIRLEHIYEKGEDPSLSIPVTVDLKDMFTPFNVISVTELTLGANLPLSELHRLQWNYSTSRKIPDTNLYFRPSSVADPFTITLNPMEIRTFQVEIQRKGF